MSVFKIFDDSSEFSSFSLDLEAVLDVLDPHIGEQAAMQFSQSNRALAQYWSPIDVIVRANDGSANNVPDLTLWRGASVIMSDRAVEALKPMISSCGEFLPLNFEGKLYALFNCRKEVAADPQRSVRIEEGGYFMDVEKLVFSDDVDTPIFKSPFENNRNLFCTDRFRTAVVENGLGGIYFGDDLTEFM